MFLREGQGTPRSHIHTWASRVRADPLKFLLLQHEESACFPLGRAWKSTQYFWAASCCFAASGALTVAWWQWEMWQVTPTLQTLPSVTQPLFIDENTYLASPFSSQKRQSFSWVWLWKGASWTLAGEGEAELWRTSGENHKSCWRNAHYLRII